MIKGLMVFLMAFLIERFRIFRVVRFLLILFATGHRVLDQTGTLSRL